MSFWSYTEQNTMVLFDINKKVGLADSLCAKTKAQSRYEDLLDRIHAGQHVMEISWDIVMEDIWKVR